MAPVIEDEPDDDYEAEQAMAVEPSLRAELHLVARNRILRGAMAVLAAQGLEATVEDVAKAAGVSRRTVFRHFAGQGQLLAAAMEEIFAVYDQSLPTSPPPPGVPLETWLENLAVTCHDLNRRVLGRAFWHVHIPGPHVPPEVVAVLSTIPDFRRGHATQAARSAWVTAGHQGSPPEWLIAAMEVQLSAFGSFALSALSPEEAGAVSARILVAVIRAAGAEVRSA